MSNTTFPFTFPVQMQLTIYPVNSGFTAFLSVDQGKLDRFHIGLTRNDVDEINAELRQAIERVSAQVRNGGCSDDDLLPLAETGKSAFNRIFTDSRAREKIVEALRSGGTIQLASEEFFLPWEILYCGSLDAPVDILGFWGMRHVVSRSLIQDTGSDGYISPTIQSERPHVGLIVYDGLRYVITTEIPALRRLNREKQIALSRLRALNANERYKELAYLDHFFCKKELHILHLACHAYEGELKSQSYLRVSDKFDITMKDFWAREFTIKYHPFVILNACLSGIISPLYTSNWASLFWERGARGVLATEIHIPDDFAALFTEQLYKYFLAGMPIGEALLATRGYFWNKQRNPLGLAYALYSSPLIRIENPDQEKEFTAALPVYA